jgi:hypothetical protein
MSRFIKFGLIAAVAFVMFGAHSYVLAQQGSETGKRPDSASALAPQPEVAGINHVLERTYINSATPGFFNSVAAGMQPIDALTSIVCPGTTGTCTIEVDQNIQLYATSSSDVVSLCFVVDGSSPECPSLVDPTPAPGTFIDVTFQQKISGVSHGSHTVQSAIETSNGIDVGYYTFTYRVYKP